MERRVVEGSKESSEGVVKRVSGGDVVEMRDRKRCREW